MLDSFFRAADHHAVTALQSPDTATRAYVHVVDAFIFEKLGAANIVLEIRIAAINQDVAGLELWGQRLYRGFCRSAGWDHEPRNTGRSEFRGKVVERRGWNGTFAGHALNCISAQVGDHHFVTAAHQAPCHIRAHPPKTYHSQTHFVLLEMFFCLALRSPCSCFPVQRNHCNASATTLNSSDRPSSTSLPRC